MTGIFYPGGLRAAARRDRRPELPLAVHAVGAVADEGEPLDSPRLRAAVGPVVARGLPRVRRAALAARGARPARCASRPRAYVAAVDAEPGRPSAATRRCTAAT